MHEQIETPSLNLHWRRAPWDEAVCPFPVMQIEQLKVFGKNARGDMRAFEAAREEVGAGLVSCRLPHDRMAEGFLLEECGFRFIEMVFAPQFDLAQFDTAHQESELQVVRASEADMPALLAIAGSAFVNERFKMDPRLDPGISDRRFQNWVANTPGHPTQELLVVRDGDRLLAFFVIEILQDGTCYWHLNALAADARGKGDGRRIWSKMMAHAKCMGSRSVHTVCAARNTGVLSLYARLGFRLPPPMTTFHWVKE